MGDAVYSWYDLPSREQRAVLRLSRRGREHPDAKVARLAREWAEEPLRNDGSVLSIIFETVVGFFLESGGAGYSFVERRRAKRILRAAEASEARRRSAR